MSFDMAKNRSDELSKMALDFYNFKQNYLEHKTSSIVKNRIMNFFNATVNDWNDWHWQMKHRIDSPEQLQKLFDVTD